MPAVTPLETTTTESWEEDTQLLARNRLVISFRSVASVLNQIGAGGLNIEIATDNEPYLMDLGCAGT